MKNVIASFLTCLCLLMVISVYGQTTRTVTSNLDDGSPGTLREVIKASVSGDTIRFDNSLANQTIKLDSFSGHFRCGKKSLTIKGVISGSDTLTIDADHRSRIFSFFYGGDVTIENLRLINGNSQDKGGAISYIGNGTFTLKNNTISGNKAYLGGGAVYASSTSSIMIMNNTISGNTAYSSDTGSSGGGILVISPSSIVIMNNTVIGNTVSAYKYAAGGGIHAFSFSKSPSSVRLTNNTICGNTSTSSADSAVGGGAHAYSSTSLSVVNNTITGNKAGEGGGLQIGGGSRTIAELSGNIFSENTNDEINKGSDVSDWTSGGYNVFSDTPSQAIETDHINVNSKLLNLGPLQDNGGITMTRVPQKGSIAIDAGNPSDRSDAQNSTIIGVRDIGAAESLKRSSSSGRGKLGY